jgi:UPF0716 protein FxsA
VFAVFLFFALFLMPVLELWTIAVVGHAIGIWETIALLIVFTVVGVWLVKREGVGVWRRLNGELRAGNVPTNEIIDGALLLLAGTLLVLPGFIGDVVGLSLLLPPVRKVARAIVAWSTLKWVTRGHRAIRVLAFGAGTAFGRSRDGRQVVDITEADAPPGPRPTDASASSGGPWAPRELDR